MDVAPNQVPSSDSASRNVVGRLLTAFNSPGRTWNRKRKLVVGLGVVLVAVVVLVVLNQGRGITDGTSILDRISRLSNKPEEKWTRLTIPDREPPFFSLETAELRPYGVLPTESFYLKSHLPVSQEFVEEYLDSSVPVVVEAVNGQEYLITPASTLALDDVFQVKLLVKDQEVGGNVFDRDYSWAYQTQGKFRVVGHVPGDAKRDVPIHTGIEITFSQPDYEDPSNLIEIEPRVNYRVERHEETVAIVPLEPLHPTTVYTVRLGAGLNLDSRNDPITEPLEFSFQTGELPSETSPRPYLNLSKRDLQVAPNVRAQLRVYTYNWDHGSDITANVYRFNSVGDFWSSQQPMNEASSRWYSYYPEANEIDTSKAEFVTTFDLAVQRQEGEEDYLTTEYLEFPEALPKGFYFVRLNYANGERKEQLWLQSTSLASYASVGRSQSVVWTNDVESGLAVGGATVSLIGGVDLATSNDQGVAMFNSPTELFEVGRHHLLVRQEDNELLVPVSSLVDKVKPGELNADDYWSYLYQERRIYKPTDLVKFWGVVRNKDTDQVPAGVTVSLHSSSWSQQASVNIERLISPQSDGTFEGEIAIEELPPGWYNLTLTSGGVFLQQLGFEVLEYTKPEIEIVIESDKQAVFTDEQVTFTTRVQFYDGILARDIPLQLHESATAKKEVISTNELGSFTYVYTPTYEGKSSARSEGVTVNPDGSYQGLIEGSSWIKVFDSKVMMKTDSKQDGNQAMLTGTVHKVNLEPINRGTGTDVTGAKVNDHLVRLKLVKSWYEITENGTDYDFVEKVTRKKYTTTRRQETIEERDLRTDGQGNFDYQFQMEEDRSYTLELVTYDEDQHAYKVSEYYYHYKGGNQGQSTTSSHPKLRIDETDNAYSIGDEVAVRIDSGEGSYQDTDENRFLFLVAQRGRMEANVIDQPEFRFGFDEKYVPSIYVGSVIFTGNSYQIPQASCSWNWRCSDYFYYNNFYEEYLFNGLLLVYDSVDSTLSLEVRKDKLEYLPGEEAKVTVRVTDTEGNPVTGASVQLTMVDKALEAIGGVRVPSILSTLYSADDSFIYYSYHSHQPLFPEEPQAEKGGGGGDGARELFKDTAYFETAVTDDTGEAVVDITLPDNITSWIMYAQAVTNDVAAGQVESSLIATQDFFVTTHFPGEVLAGDSPVLSARGFGDGLMGNETIQFESAIFSGDTELTRESRQGQAFRELGFTFPPLGLGEYSLVVSGETGDYSDGVRLPLLVKNSRYMMQLSNSIVLNEGESITELGTDSYMEDEEVRLQISDEGKGKYLRMLMNYYCGSSNRLEKKLARYRASQLLEEYFEYDTCTPSSEELAAFQNPDGGLAQVNWGGSYLETTVWAAVIDPNLFDKDSLVEYLRSQLEAEDAGTVQQIYAAWGLTAMGEPELTRLRLLENFASNYEEKVLLGLALASAGETELARELYYDVLADYGYSSSPYIRIQADAKENRDQYLVDTSQALLLGALVDKHYNQGFYEYLRNYRNLAQDVVLDLADIAFVEELLQEIPEEDTVVRFSSNARSEEMELSERGSWMIVIGADEVPSFRLDVVAGKADVERVFSSDKSILENVKADSRLAIKRSYTKVKGTGSDFQPGDIVRVDIQAVYDQDEAPKGGYEVVDLLPSGLIHISNPSSYGFSDSSYMNQVTTNRLSYRFYNSRYYNGRVDIRYYARVTAAGTYVAEPALLQSQIDLMVFATTPERSITIKAYEN